jgi:PEP-CTERM motif
MKFQFLKASFMGVVLSVSCFFNVANAGIIDSNLYMAGYGSSNYLTYDFNTNLISSSSGNQVNNGLAWDSTNGIMYGLNGSTLYTIDPITGLSISSTSLSSGTSGLAFDSDSSLLYSSVSGQIQTVNPITGVVSNVGSTGVGEWIIDISFDSLNNLFGVGIGGGLYSIDKLTGNASQLFSNVTANTASSGVSGFTAFAINDLNKFYGLTISGDRLVEINTTTGTSSIIADLSSYDWDIRGMTFRNPTVDVPEPSTLAIFALGMIGLASRRFKKQS